MSADLHLRRVIAAPRGLVWDCWTRPDLLKQWFCPRPNGVTEAHIDLRPGGRFDFTLSVEGQLHSYANCYLEIIPGEKLVYTDLMSAGWHPVDGPFLGYSAEITLTDDGGGTAYHVIARHKTPKAAERHDRMGFTEGWGVCADQLNELAASLA